MHTYYSSELKKFRLMLFQRLNWLQFYGTDKGGYWWTWSNRHNNEKGILCRHRGAIQLQRGMLYSGVVLIHDNVGPDLQTTPWATRKFMTIHHLVRARQVISIYSKIWSNGCANNSSLQEASWNLCYNTTNASTVFVIMKKKVRLWWFLILTCHVSSFFIP